MLKFVFIGRLVFGGRTIVEPDDDDDDEEEGGGEAKPPLNIEGLRNALLPAR